MASQDSFGAKGTLEVGDQSYEIYRLSAVTGDGLDVESLPYSLKVLLENLLRTEDGENVTSEDVEKVARWDHTATPSEEIAFTPSRVLMQDFTGVPAIVDLAAMREAMAEMSGDPAKINPLGGAIALGHPLGATGAIRAATVVHGLRRRNLKYGMVTMCVGTGMGAAGIIERL